ncbi:hypothetical protein HMPREF2996_00320 [Corynebacterium sp. HMSC066C02]|nr:hypothetical protein HMPREF2996_00320 [Corynebacterium sp. HMSC066C02]
MVLNRLATNRRREIGIVPDCFRIVRPIRQLYGASVAIQEFERDERNIWTIIIGNSLNKQ